MNESYDLDYYVNNDVKLEIRHFTQPLRNEYWITVHTASVLMYEKEWCDLCELIAAYNQEDCSIYHERKILFNNSWLVFGFIVFLIGLAIGVVI